MDLVFFEDKTGVWRHAVITTLNAIWVQKYGGVVDINVTECGMLR